MMAMNTMTKMMIMAFVELAVNAKQITAVS